MNNQESSTNIINYNDIITGIVGGVYKMVRGHSTDSSIKYGAQQLANSALSHNLKKYYNPMSPVDMQYLYQGAFQYAGDQLMHQGPSLYKSLESSVVAYAGDVIANVQGVKQLNVVGF